MCGACWLSVLSSQLLVGGEESGVRAAGIPEFGLVVVAGGGGVEEGAVVPLVVGAAAEGVVAGGVVVIAAGELAVSVFFSGALGASVDVEPDHGVAGVDLFGLGDVEVVEGTGVGGVAELVDDGDDFGVGGGGGGDEGEGAFGGFGGRG